MADKKFKLYTYQEVAEIIRIHPVTLRRWVSEKRIPHIRIGGTLVRFREEDLKNILQFWEVNEHEK